MRGRKQTKQSRRTKWRKDRQQAEREMQRLRERALGFEGMSPRLVAWMAKADLERVVASGKRRKMVTPFDGIALAMAVAASAR